jgi:ATP-dependent DNA helicase RecG
MTDLLDQLREWMEGRENEHLEFKEAKNNFHFDKLVDYCAALSNEGGGRIILGVTDKRPRRVVGTRTFPELERTKAGLVERLHLRIDALEIAHPDGRVLVFTAPPHPLGMTVQHKGTYWMRAGDDLAPMTPDMLKRILDETGPDFSAEICARAPLADLDSAAIEQFRARWRRKSGNTALDRMPVEQLLEDAELRVNGGITYAALVLLGTRQALGRLLAHAEVVFEYRSSEVAGPAQQRVEQRQGFLLFVDELWSTINLRNDLQHFQDGLYIWDIPTFNETAIREAILNAVGHRDYRHGGSVFVRQFPRRLEIVSPGGFPQGITPENILWRQMPRNRRIAESFARCGLVERAGQGMDRIFQECIRESKPLPDFTQTDDYQVSITLPGQIQDPQFLRFLERVGQEQVASFTAHDFLVLDLVHRDQAIPEPLRPRLPDLLELGVIEPAGRGRFILSRRFYSFLGQKGVYTRKRGLDRETNKELLFKHIRDNANEGSQLRELTQLLPALSRRQIQKLVQELRAEERVHMAGHTSAGRWYPGQPPPEVTPAADDQARIDRP